MFPEGIEAEFRKLYSEGAQGFAPVNFAALRALVPLSHILFGSDYNRFPISHTVQELERLRISPESRRAIERENAIPLLPRWKT